MRMRVWLASFPRSGNIFARLVLKEVYGIASDTVYPNEAGGKLARFLAETAREQPSDRPWFTKTHEIARPTNRAQRCTSSAMDATRMSRTRISRDTPNPPVTPR
jgi:hypothetical protein